MAQQGHSDLPGDGGGGLRPASFRLEQRDAFEWLSGLMPRSVELVVTDPPYASLEQHRSVGTTTRLAQSRSSNNAWFDVVTDEGLADMMSLLYDALDANTHCYVFSDSTSMFPLVAAGKKVGFKFWKPLVWDKVTMGMGYHYRCRYEFILFFEKGKRPLADKSTPDVLRVPRLHRARPAEKPVSLAETLVRMSSQPGETVCDPFIGSGAFGEAALRLDRHFLGCDSDSDNVIYATKRLEKALEPPEA